MKRFVFVFTFLTISVYTFAQGEFNNWCFGKGVKLNFNSGSPVVSSSAIQGWDNSASISDSLGNLLFYTDGVTVWNKNDQIMPNGAGLQGDTTGGQAATIVKQPGNDSLYYIFTMDDGFTNNYGFRYSVVNMNLNGGLGDVETAGKNTLLVATNSEKIVPVPHADGVNIWIVMHEANNNTFRSYLLTPDGLQTTPIISSVGTSQSGTNDFMGQLTVNKAKNRLACVLYGSDLIELFNFNNYLGLVSNPITISGVSKPLGVEFSPDGSKLYVTEFLSSNLDQFNLSTYTQSAIIASKVSVGTIPANYASYHGGYVMLGPDDKIYVTPTFGNYIGRIDNPNVTGAGCNYNGTAVNLSPKGVQAGLVTKIGVTKPNCVIEIVNEIKVVTEGNNELVLNPNPTRGILNVQFPHAALFDLSVFDISGALVTERHQETGTTTLNLNGLAKGTYIITGTNRLTGTQVSKKIIIE